MNKKIFATYDAKANRACIRLSVIDQDVFSLADKTLIYPVSNKWGNQGWTFIEMGNVRKAIFADALASAYCAVAPKRLADVVRAGSGK